MITKANKFFLVIIIVFVVEVVIIWNNVNIGLNKEFLLRKTYAQYIVFFNVKVCDQAYNFISAHSKEVNSDKFKDACKNQSSIDRKEKVSQIVFTNSWTAKILISYKAIVDNKNVDANDTMTWVFENGSWKRDWPD